MHAPPSPAVAPLLVLLGAGPGAPGAAASMARATALGDEGPVEVLLHHEGLTWRGTEALADWTRRPGMRVALCSADAREAGWTLESAPPGVAWSAVTSALRNPGRYRAIWAVLP